jgi:hypothetical protein
MPTSFLLGGIVFPVVPNFPSASAPPPARSTEVGCCVSCRVGGHTSDMARGGLPLGVFGRKRVPGSLGEKLVVGGRKCLGHWRVDGGVHERVIGVCGIFKLILSTSACVNVR